MQANGSSNDTLTPSEEVADLEQRLLEAKARLAAQSDSDKSPTTLQVKPSSPRLHPLLLLSDSALPLGSFAFSSGLESFLAHQPKHAQNATTFSKFLSLSLASIAGLTLPYVIAGYEEPQRLDELDNDFDASTTCTVARRASVKQGRALMAVWDRSFKAQFRLSEGGAGRTHDAQAVLRDFGVGLRSAPEANDQFGNFTPNGHLPPLFGVVCAALAMQLGDVLYMYLFNHVKTVVSAGIRAGVLGPYQAQGVLAGEGLRGRVNAIIENELLSRKSTTEAGQSVPLMDIWGGRHEIIYSRIFNS